MKDTDQLHIEMSQEAFDRLFSVMTRLNVNENWALQAAMAYFDGITEATFSEKQDVCFLDEKGNPVSVSEKLKDLADGKSIELWDEPREPSHYTPDISLTADTVQTLNRLGAKLNLSPGETLNHASLFFSSLVTLTKQGKNVAHRDYSNGSDVSFSDPVRSILERAQTNNMTSLQAIAANYDHAPGAEPKTEPEFEPNYENFRFSKEVEAHLNALASELEIEPEEVLDGWLTSVHLGKNPELAQEALDAAAAAESQYLEDFIEYATADLQGGVEPRFGGQLGKYLRGRAETLGSADEHCIQAYLEARIIKQQYLQHTGQEREWSDDFFSTIAEMAQDNSEALFGQVMDEMIIAIDDGCTPHNLVKKMKDLPAKLPSKAVLSSVPSDNALTDPEHEGNLIEAASRTL